MSRLAGISVLGVCLLLASPASAFQWGPVPEEPHEVDLVVEATLVRSDASVVFAHGAVYERTRSTLLVHRVLYRDAEAPLPGATLELFAGQRGMPHILHGREALRRGLWLLSRSETEGVWTANRSRPFLPELSLAPLEPGVALGDGWFDPTTGEAELEVRYENFGPGPVVLDELSFDAFGRARGLGTGITLRPDFERPGIDLARSLEPARGQVHLAPWTFVRRTVRFPLPAAARGARSGVRVESLRLPRVRDPVSGAERVVVDLPLGANPVRPLREGSLLHPRRLADERWTDDLPPPWLAPTSPCWTLFRWPPVWLVALGLVGGAWAARTRRRRRVGAWILTVCAGLLPWALLGPSPLLVTSPLPAAALLLDAGLLALLARVTRVRGVVLPAPARAFLLPAALLLAAHVALLGRL